MKKALLLALLLTACAPHPAQELHSNPPKLNFTSNADRYVAEGYQTGAHTTYRVFSVQDTHSMEPFLDKTMDVIVDTEFPFEDLKIDDIIIYHAIWWTTPADVCHRVNAIEDNSLIVSGDNNANYERGIYGVTRENYHGKVVLVMVLNK